MSERATGAVCRPNFGAAGRRRRTSFAAASGALFLVGLGAAIALGAPWYLRALAALPAGAALVSGLQVTRNTCVAHAATGSIEDERFRLTKAEPEAAAASRRVAATIWRDALLGMALAAALSAATAWLV